MRFGKYVLAGIGLLVLSLSPALANEPGTWTMYAGVGSVNPDGKGISFTAPDDEFGEVAVGFEVDRATSMTIGATYMFDENWAVDILGAWPFTHDIRATVDVPGESGSAKIGDFKHLPPTISLQYHFTTAGMFDPYVGIGLNYTRFSNEKLIPDIANEGLEKFCLENSTGITAQIGGHWELSDNWNFNVDVRYIDIESDLTLEGPAFDVVGSNKAAVGTVTVDPLVYSMNVGYHFR